MKFSKFITNADLSEIAHTSGHAKAAFGGRIGSTSRTSFEERQRVNENRKKIAEYGKSKIGLHGVARASRAVTPQEVAKLQAKDHLKSIVEKNYTTRRAKPQFGETNGFSVTNNKIPGASTQSANSGTAPVVSQIGFKEPEPRNFHP